MWKFYFVIIVFFLTLNEFGVCSVTSKMQQLLDEIKANATSEIRPGLDDDYPLEVNITLHLEAITELNEVKGFITTIGYFDVLWYDDRIFWNPEDYEDIIYVPVESSKVWIPKLIVSNPADQIYAFRDVSQDVVFTSYGLAIWLPGTVMKTICYMKIPGYPFDTHTCYIEVSSWDGLSVSGLQWDITLFSPDNELVTKHYFENSEWDLRNTSVWNENPRYISFGLTIARKSTFLVFNILIPTVFLSLLNPLVFLLPQQSGERISYSVTILLSFAVFLDVISNNIPKTSSPMPYLCHYVLIVLIASGAITFATIITQKLYLAHGTEPAPRWLRICLCFRSSTANNKVSDDTENNGKSPGDTADRHKTTSNISKGVTMEDIVIKLDKVLFVIFTLFTITLPVGFIIVMSAP